MTKKFPETIRISTGKFKKQLDKVEDIEKYLEGAEGFIMQIASRGRVTLHSLLKDEVSIGRDDMADIKIVDHGVSRFHAVIVRAAGGRFYLKDLDSTNGTFCNGERVTRKLLKESDRIMIGGHSILKFSTNVGINFSADGQFEKEMKEEFENLNKLVGRLGKSLLRKQKDETGKVSDPENREADLN